MVIDVIYFSGITIKNSFPRLHDAQ